MQNVNPNLPPGFREAFDSARETTVNQLIKAVEGAGEVTCGPLDGFGMFGWQFEGHDPSLSNQMQGATDYAVAYLRNMIDQGFCIGFAVWRSEEQALVCLKTWEPSENEPTWPREIHDAVVVYHKPVQL